MCSLIILKEGKEIARYNRIENIRLNQYSVSKSFVSTAVGMAVDDNKLSLDECIFDYFKDDMPENPRKKWSYVTVRNLLTMSLGLDRAILHGELRYRQKNIDWPKHIFRHKFSKAPGSRFVYNNEGSYLAGLIVERIYGCNLVEFLMPRLFEPLGIYLPTWERDPMGSIFGSSGLMLTTEEIAKFAQLYLQGGIWKSNRLISNSWVDMVSKCQIETGEDNNPWRSKYSFFFWLGPGNSFRADGKYGQYAIVFPDKDCVVAINSFYDEDNDEILNSLWRYIYPKI
ncbi:MAG: serine hydrolase [Ruminococcaceae bacterium]|nr:serine hydrolase [Oscillospiraceae bacterium]